MLSIWYNLSPVYSLASELPYIRQVIFPLYTGDSTHEKHRMIQKKIFHIEQTYMRITK